MKLAAMIAFAFALGACSPAEDQRAREQAHKTGEQMKHDTKEVLEDAKVGAQKASRELDNGLHKTREKIREALNEPKDPPKEKERR